MQREGSSPRRRTSPALAAQRGASKPQAPGTLRPGGRLRGEPGGLFRALPPRLQGAPGDAGAEDGGAEALQLPSGFRTWGGTTGHRRLPSRARSGFTAASLPGSSELHRPVWHGAGTGCSATPQSAWSRAECTLLTVFNHRALWRFVTTESVTGSLALSIRL